MNRMRILTAPGAGVRRFSWISCLFLALLSACSLTEIYIRPDVPLAGADAGDEETYSQSLFLIGDAGNPSRDQQEPTLRALQRHAARNPENSFVLWLGDNVYNNGLPTLNHPEREEMQRRLDAQVDVIRNSGARGAFIPGNHDWDSHSDNGWEQIVRQERYINALGDSSIQFQPRGGCPGPEVIDIGHELRLILLDTQWWLHPGPKPLHPESDCPCDSDEEILSALEMQLRTAGSRHVIVAGHHPFRSHGTHGGFFAWEEYIFPLRRLHSWLWLPLPIPVIPLARKWGSSDQDIAGGRHQEMIADIRSVLDRYAPLAYASGHDHSLQILKSDEPYYYLVSGAGCAETESMLSYDDDTVFAYHHVGFMRLDFTSKGAVRLAVIIPIGDGSKDREVFATWLKSPD